MPGSEGCTSTRGQFRQPLEIGTPEQRPEFPCRHSATGLRLNMHDCDKTKEQLIQELSSLRKELQAAGHSPPSLSASRPLSVRGLRNILTSVPFGISYHEEGRLKWANKAMLQMFGFHSLREALKTDPSDMFASTDEYQLFRDFLRRRKTPGDQAGEDVRFKRRDGSIFVGHVQVNWGDPSTLEAAALVCVSDVSWRVQAEEALRESEQLLRSILVASPVGLCRVEERRFQWVNQAMVDMLGFRSEDDLVGKDTRIIYDSPEEYHRAGDVLYRGSQRGPISRTYAKLVRTDGSVFDAHLRVSAPDQTNRMKGTVAAVSDISWIKESEEALVESERRFREILENIHLVAVGLDLEGKITFCNDFLLELSGRRRGEVVGQSWFEMFVPSEYRRKQRHRFRRLQSGRIAMYGRTAIVTKTGERRIISWNNTILRDPATNIIGVASIGEDITDRKRADAILLQTERIKAVGEMAGGVAHNFNNLLQIVMGAAQMALVNLELGNVHEMRPNLEQIVKSTRLGAQTVQRLQEFARVRSENGDSEGEVFDLSRIVRQAAEMSSPWWKTSPEREGIKVTLATDLGAGCLIMGKENELFEVAVNLIKNAAEALPRGGEIRLATSAEGDEVLFQVEDNGVGIPKYCLGRVFEPFWTTKGFQGTGMGLSSCLGIITEHGGTIGVESTDGRGTTFTVRLPRTERLAGPPARSSDVTERSFRILLIDDMEGVLEILGEALEEHGQTVHTALSGEQAMKIFQEHPIDVVVCDLGMEGMNGWQVSRAVRDHCLRNAVPKTPFVLLTGWGGQISDERRLFEAGIDRLVSKPVMVSALLEVLREVMQYPAGEQSPLRGNSDPV